MVGIRGMRMADARGVAEVRVRGWQAAYAGLLPRSYLDGMSVEEDAALRRRLLVDGRGQVANLVAVDEGGDVVGWAALGAGREAGAGAAPGAGELYALYVRPELVGTGIGRALIGAVHEEAGRRAMPELLLWVLEGNARARAFYERAGYACDGVARPDEYDGVVAVEVRYRRGL